MTNNISFCRQDLLNLRFHPILNRTSLIKTHQNQTMMLHHTNKFKEHQNMTFHLLRISLNNHKIQAINQLKDHQVKIYTNIMQALLFLQTVNRNSCVLVTDSISHHIQMIARNISSVQIDKSIFTNAVSVSIGITFTLNVI